MLNNILETFGHIIYQIILSVAVVAAAWLAKKFISDRLIDNFTKKIKLKDHAAKPIKKIFGVVIYIVAIFVLLGIWGLRGTLTGLLAGAGIIGIVIGFATRDVVSDLLAGIVLFFDRPFEIGDAIVIGDLGGKVLDIGLRSVKIKTWDGVFVTIPNRKVHSEVVKNYTHYHTRRLDFVVGVDYDSDLNKVREIFNRILERKDLPVLREPAPMFFLDKLGPSSIDFKILFWFSYQDMEKAGISFFNLKGKIIQTIVEEFKKEKITIPFPQITLSQRAGGPPATEG